MNSQAVGGRQEDSFLRTTLMGMSLPLKTRPFHCGGESALVYHQVIVPGPSAKGFAQTILVSSLLL